MFLPPPKKKYRAIVIAHWNSTCLANTSSWVLVPKKKNTTPDPWQPPLPLGSLSFEYSDKFCHRHLSFLLWVFLLREARKFHEPKNDRVNCPTPERHPACSALVLHGSHFLGCPDLWRSDPNTQRKYNAANRDLRGREKRKSWGQWVRWTRFVRKESKTWRHQRALELLGMLWKYIIRVWNHPEGAYYFTCPLLLEWQIPGFPLFLFACLFCFIYFKEGQIAYLQFKNGPTSWDKLSTQCLS